MSTQPLAAAGPPLALKEPRRPSRHGRLRAAEVRWGLAFIAPYVAVFLAFVVHPYAYVLWMAAEPSLYADLIDDRLFLPTLVNTLLFVGLGVNLKMFLALLLSGFFLRPRRWIRILLAIYVLPWALRGGADLPLLSLDADRRTGPRGRSSVAALRHRGADLVQRPLARPRLGYRRLSVEMDAVLDADLSRGAFDDPARHL